MIMSGKEKLIFISSFIWFLHWGSCLTLHIMDMVIEKDFVRMFPVGF